MRLRSAQWRSAGGSSASAAPVVTSAAGKVGKSRWSDQPEFVVVTHWDSTDALESFAGEDWRQAVVEPEEEHMLTEVFCDHYEAIEAG